MQIGSCVRDFDKAETAVLRQANDIYRKTIFNAQVYLNSGAGTLRQAIDMATHDFLSAGLNCIQYRDGRRVNIASYAEMALRTANKRAYMQGEGTKCDEYGIHTKLISKHGGACPLCVRWQGRVVIDDVYSSGTAKESKKTGFPLLSQAITDGMFHPNCKNGLSLFIPGINAVPEQPTAEEIKSQTEQYDLEQKQRYNERQIRKYKRLADGSLDPENQKKYTEKLREWQKRQRDLIGQHPDKLRRQYDREQIFKDALTPLQFNGTIEKRPLLRAKDTHRKNIKVISDRRFDELTIEARKHGAVIIRGTEDAERHLDAQGADAAILNDVIIFRKEVCVSEVLEETYHFMQNIAKMNDDKDEPLRTFLNEIDAKKHLLNISKKYKIPRSETELTEKQLKSYQKLLEEYMEGYNENV